MFDTRRSQRKKYLNSRNDFVEGTRLHITIKSVCKRIIALREDEWVPGLTRAGRVALIKEVTDLLLEGADPNTVGTCYKITPIKMALNLGLYPLVKKFFEIQGEDVIPLKLQTIEDLMNALDPTDELDKDLLFYIESKITTAHRAEQPSRGLAP